MFNDVQKDNEKTQLSDVINGTRKRNTKITC